MAHASHCEALTLKYEVTCQGHPMSEHRDLENSHTGGIVPELLGHQGPASGGLDRTVIESWVWSSKQCMHSVAVSRSCTVQPRTVSKGCLEGGHHP
jgi:hypothetical protein